MTIDVDGQANDVGQRGSWRLKKDLLRYSIFVKINPHLILY